MPHHHPHCAPPPYTCCNRPSTCSCCVSTNAACTHHVPKPQATYITNHYHSSQPTQPKPRPRPTYVKPEPAIDWVSTTPSMASAYTHRAFVGGKEGWDGSPLWIIRAHHSGEFIPGKLAIKHRVAYVPHGGKEIPVHHFDLLLAKPGSVKWLPSSNGGVPPKAIPAGNTHTGEPLYIAKVYHKNSFTPGKVHPSHHSAYISFGGKEVPCKNYEVLCYV